MVESDFFDKIVRIRNTYIITPGFEVHLAEKLHDLSVTSASSLLRYLPKSLLSGSTEAAIQADVERAAYAAFHSKLFPHLVHALRFRNRLYKRNLKPLQTRIRSLLVSSTSLLHEGQLDSTDRSRSFLSLLSDLGAPNDFSLMLSACTVQEGCLQLLIDIHKEVGEVELDCLDTLITPQQKLSHLKAAMKRLSSILSRAVDNANRQYVFLGAAKSHSSAFIVASEHLQFLCLLAIACSRVSNIFSHFAHMDMFITASNNTLDSSEGM